MPASSFKLNNGNTIPSVALGSFTLIDPKEARDIVFNAIKVGVRHFDSADWYRSEQQLGDAIHEAIDQGLVKREELFITTKVWNDQQPFAIESLQKSLKKFRLDYIDLFLIHWPIAFRQVADENNNMISHPSVKQIKELGMYDYKWNFVKTWKLLEKAYETGLAKNIGISNFSIGKIKIILEHAKIPPAVNQIEVNPYDPQLELVEFCQKNNIVVEGYSPFGSVNKDLLADPDIKKLAKKNNVEAGTVVTSWLVARGIVAIAKTSKKERLEQNFNLIDLPAEDIEALNKLADRKFGGGGRTGEEDWIPDGLFDDTDLDRWNFNDTEIPFKY